MPKSLPIPQWIKYIFTTGVFVGLGLLLFKYHEDFYIVRDLSTSQFFSVSLLIIFGIALSGSKLNRIANCFGVRLKRGEWLMLSSMTTILNSIFFKSGSLATSTYLKKKYHFPYASFAGTFLGDQLIILFIATLFGSVASLYLIFPGNSQLFPIFVVFALITILLFSLLCGQIRLPKKETTTFDPLRRGIESFNMLLRNKDLLYSLCIHNIFLITTTGLRLFMACSILHQEIPLSHCFLFAATMIFIRIIPITHSDIGVREITVGFLSEILGSGLKAGVLITTTDRIFELLWTGLCVSVFRNFLITPKD